MTSRSQLITVAFLALSTALATGCGGEEYDDIMSVEQAVARGDTVTCTSTTTDTLNAKTGEQTLILVSTCVNHTQGTTSTITTVVAGDGDKTTVDSECLEVTDTATGEPILKDGDC